MRQIPCLLPPRPAEVSDPSAFTIDVITPLYGGGVKAGENDLLDPVRGTAVRGHLRFWWRATRGAACPTYQQMREEELRIWGGTGARSPVSLHVEIINAGTQEVSEVQVYNPRKQRNEPRFRPDYPPYFSFPLKSDTQGRPAGKTLRDLSFRLMIECQSQFKADVETALWAWTTYGGLGARTRRGFGALVCSPVPNHEYQVHSDALQWPVLVGNPIYRGPDPDPFTAWKYLSETYFGFRQAPVGRRSGGRPGRSYWPEPDSLREMTNSGDPRHRPPNPITMLNLKTQPVFPRAQFGLPIVFKFLPRRCPDEVLNSELYPGDSERMASPLIFRPVKRADGYYGMIAVLRAPKPSALRLKFDNGRSTASDPPLLLSRPDLGRYPNSPIAKAAPGLDPIEAFLAHASGRGFK